MVHATDVAAGFLVASGIAGAVLLVLALNGYRRSGETALALVGAAFGVFTVKSFLVAYSLWSGLIEHEILELVDAIGDLGVIALLVAPLLVAKR